ncbi:MAG: zinc metallopeptidase [Candidatus Krumholzibacteria bacterium]|nr:zinc metallopeptidase [Candidatus Krumholzibacteria bacterium]MDH4335786.1 zinc metallopeptidase [Candidatus Krumholzibacteria bacterium]MDH5269312.1 zinc metallopeptidase [Candidatus Krumholzibacteria bacterium]
MFFDPLYWLVIGAGMILSIWAAMKTKGTFQKYSQYTTQSRMTGAQVAQAILRDANINDVKIEPIHGNLTDHYDPRTKTLRLSEGVYGSTSMSAAGVAAHEVGHAIQHAQNYGPLKFRSAWVPVANLGGGISIFVLIAAAFLGGAQSVLGAKVALLGVLLFATTTVFTLVTLPVEFDASKRALATLGRGGYLTREELSGAKSVLDAAAMTYVAAFVTSALTLLYWAMRLGLLGGRRSD